jgi:uncharacterized protein (DUF58 family)
MTVGEFHYLIDWRARGHRPGHHRATGGGGEFQFHSHAPLLAVSDPRRLDIRASLRDPMGQWLVRVHHQRSAIPVYLIADLSASMGFTGLTRKFDVLADFTVAAAYSAFRTGDRFGFIGCDARVREDYFLAPTLARGAGVEIAERLRGTAPSAPVSDALLDAPRHLARQRSLVFLVSDFHFSIERAREICTRLSRHDVVPVVLWEARETVAPGRGLGSATLRDSETGEHRRFFLRRSLRDRIAANYASRRRALRRMFRAFGREPFFLIGNFRADALTAYFLHEPDPDGAH